MVWLKLSFLLKCFWRFVNTVEAFQLYADECSALEDDGKEQVDFDLYHSATTIYIN